MAYVTTGVCHRLVDRSVWFATLYCSILATAFVGSLYLLVPIHVQLYHRDHASQIKWRCFGTSIICVIALCSFSTFFCDEYSTTYVPVATLIQNEGVACFSVLGHTAVLFLGPLLLNIVAVYDTVKRLDGMVDMHRFKEVFNERLIYPITTSLLHPRNASERWIRLRNLLIAPLAEEIVFRACMVPAFCSTGMSIPRVCLVVPLFFGFAHVHHVILKVRQGHSLVSIFVQTCFQFAYTTAFGAYESYAYTRTNSLAAVTLCHIFCNAMGLPDLQFLNPNSPLYPYRTLLLSTLILGFGTFVVGLAAFDWPTLTTHVMVRP